MEIENGHPVYNLIKLKSLLNEVLITNDEDTSTIQKNTEKMQLFTFFCLIHINRDWIRYF